MRGKGRTCTHGRQKGERELYDSGTLHGIGRIVLEPFRTRQSGPRRARCFIAIDSQWLVNSTRILIITTFVYDRLQVNQSHPMSAMA